MRAANVNLVASKEHYVDKIASLQDQVESLRTTLDSKSALVAQLQSRLDELESSMYGIVKDARVALEEACHQRDKKIRSLQHVLKEKEQSISALEKGREDISHRYNSLVAEQASASIDAQTSSFRLNAEDGELERLTKEIARLKSADAAKEVSRPRVSSPRSCDRTDTLSARSPGSHRSPHPISGRSVRDAGGCRDRFGLQAAGAGTRESASAFRLCRGMLTGLAILAPR